MLGEAGLSTLLVDKSEFPRDKPCGGGISARVLTRFPYLRPALQNIPVHWVTKIHFEAPSGVAVDHASRTPLYLMIRRVEFDNLVFSMARNNVDWAGPALVRKVIVESDGVTVEADAAGERQVYRAKIVLGCDGANSIVARAAGLRSGSVQNDYAIDMMEETPYQELSLEDREWMYVYYGFEGAFGYGYVFPKADHVNLGVGCKLSFYLSKFHGDHYQQHRSFVDKLISQKLLSGRSRRENFRAFPIPISGPLARTWSDRVLLAGDAGGFVNAFTAEGIYYAMVSGELAARTAVQALRANDFSGQSLGSYERGWKQEIGEDLAKSVAIQRVLLKDLSRVDRVVSAARRNPALAALLAEYATGAITYRHFKRSLIFKALPLYARERLRAWLAAKSLSVD